MKASASWNTRRRRGGDQCERKRGDTNKGTGQEREREREDWGERREDITINKKEEEERPHGRLTVGHVRDLADIPRGNVLVEGSGIFKH